MAYIWGTSGNDIYTLTTIPSTTNDADTVYGNDGADSVEGANRPDYLDGGNGADTLNGGWGSDTIYGRWGNDSIFGGNDNDLLMGGEGSDFLSGGSGSDTLYGEGGDDILVDYQGGVDELRGGTGSDSYSVYSTGDIVIENAGGGTDSVYLEIFTGSYTITNNVEHLTSHSFGVTTVNGNGLSNRMTNWNDAVVFRGGGGNDTLTGTYSDETLEGGTGRDSLIGDSGDNILNGGAGADILIGGEDTDVFKFNAASDSTPGTSGGQPNFDQIRTYDGTNSFDDGDRIDVSAIDAHTGAAGNQAFVWGGEIALGATGQRGWLYVSDSAGGTLIRGNTDNNPDWDFQVEIEDGPRDASWYLSSDIVL